MTDYNRIPLPLRERAQWVCWRYEDRLTGKKATKVPYCAVTGYAASVTDPMTWCSFEQAMAAMDMEPCPYNGIGFVLTALDPFALVDIDAVDDDEMKQRQLALIESFDSYTELSPSGNGWHIIVRGSVEKGRNRRPLEVYSTARFFTCTGNVVRDVPVADRDELLNELWHELAPKSANSIVCHDGNSPQTHDDNGVCAMAYAAANGQKFYDLYMGKWQDHYSSQSEADFALIDILAYYTKNGAQIQRIFMSSALGQREKAQRPDYVPQMVQRSFDRMLPEVSIAGLLETLTARETPTLIASLAPEEAEVQRTIALPQLAIGTLPFVHSAYTKPRGLIGDIAQFIYDAAPRPVAELALAGAIGMMSGICGKAFNVSGTGLNQYLVAIAVTGTGKEAISSGIDQLISQVGISTPAAHNFIGPSDMASPQGLLNYMSDGNTCFVSLIGECGMWLSNLSSATSNAAQLGLRRILLDIYGKSGHGQAIRPTVYAEKAKNTKVVKSPNVTILGDSTPEKFFEVITPDLLAEGLVSRFMLVHYAGKRPPLNKERGNAVPVRGLIDMLSALCQTCHATMEASRVCNVPLDALADDAASLYNERCDDYINEATTDVVRQLWSRAYLKMLKLAALSAVGRNIYNPVIDSEDVAWAARIVDYDVKVMLERFESGDIGGSVKGLRQDGKQLEMALKVTQEFFALDATRLVTYGASLLHVENRCIPWAYYQRRLYNLKLFSNDPRGAAQAVASAVKGLVEQGTLAQVSPTKTAELFRSTAATYCVM